MRTTLEIEDKLFRKAKAKAARLGISLKQLVEDALRAALLSKPVSGARFRLKWKTVSGKQLPGVNINDRDSLFDKMEGKD